ncbi:MAG: RNA methyltransferase, partial [Alphaproteobacteria bacterium]|nr:RNA methyltransferase [Alphaproteobacteria bacterium]
MLTFRIVLVEPLYSGNIGSTARVIKNFGFSELVLLNPCDIDNDARIMSVHAYDVIENATIATTIEEAVEGSNMIIGMTGLPGKTENKHKRMPALP